MPASDLPIEIQEQVLDHLHDDPYALKACSLACSAWLPTARLHLFRTVKLRTVRDCLRFLTVLESTSDALGGIGVGSLVRELHLPTMVLRQAGRRKGQRYNFLCQILRCVPNIDTLVARRFQLRSFLDLASPKGTSPGVDLRGVLTSVFAFPRLKTLVLQRTSVRTVREVLQVISAFPSLSTLWISDIHISSPDDVHPNTTESTDIRICIQDLRLGPWDGDPISLQAVTEAFLEAPYELQLRKLQWMSGLRHADFGGHAFNEMFHRSAGTLETLELEVDEAAQCIGWLMGQGLSHHRSLKILTLSFDLFDGTARDRSMIPLFISSLDSSSLRELKLHFDAHDERDSQNAFDWQELPKALISLHRRCPAVTLTLSCCVPTRMWIKLPDLVAVYLKTLQGVLHAGRRIAIVRTELDQSCPCSVRDWFEVAMDNRWRPARPALIWL
ncbi:uncharacterized protein B0H18DRAFT_1219957 [Fomitopsis serialis]|uniref:uncharacterized protein n=1 Tax=Fomitopsis serialis TaxID=139415 RepID=UPI00200843D8|nr:uncharacterized protein B0H18DRAFT_1219957 [Neoantrodia serialis]KAH9908808.1 hypothetical protein B0H18DRAFT_1219957 [Neoantrodia serialis]